MTTPTDPVKALAELRELEKAATPPDWYWDKVMGGIRVADFYIVQSSGFHHDPSPDEALIAALRNAAPLLLSPDHTLVSTAELESLRAVAEAARGDLSDHDSLRAAVAARRALRGALARLTEPGK